MVVLGLLAAALAACGAEEEDEGAATTPTISVANADIVSGCWTASQRRETDEEGNEVAYQQWSQPPAMTIDPAKTYKATLQTNKGDIEVEFFPRDAPQTVNNFVCLARAGYYDGTPFHRILEGFVIQGGDPTGTGRGGPGYKFNDEPITRDYLKGTLAMANAGPNTNGSQFFITLGDLRGGLSKNYTIFGQVTGGMDVVDQIGKTPTRPGPTGEPSVPTEPVTLEKVTITEG